MALTGRLTSANESDQGNDHEFGLDDLSLQPHQPDATFAPGLAGIQQLTDRSKQTAKSSVE